MERNERENRQLMTLLEYNHLAFKRNTADISYSESLILPQDGGNCINWIAGHITLSRGQMCAVLGLKDESTAAMVEVYKRGSSNAGTETASDFRKIIEIYDCYQHQVMQKLKDVHLQPSGEKAIDLVRLLFHEAYHIGQIGIVRRAIGKEGAIK